MGYTTNHGIIMENTNRIRIENLKDTKDILGMLFKAGRYVAAIITDSNNEPGMMFIDNYLIFQLNAVTAEKLKGNKFLIKSANV